MNDNAGRATITASTKKSKTPIDIKTVGVVGAGQMGSGIAHVSAMAGFDVAICDINEDQLTRAIANSDNHMDNGILA